MGEWWSKYLILGVAYLIGIVWAGQGGEATGYQFICYGVPAFAILFLAFIINDFIEWIKKNPNELKVKFVMDAARIIWFFVGFFTMFISILFTPLIDSIFLSFQPFGLKPSIFVFISGFVMIAVCWVSRQLEDFLVHDKDADLDTNHYKVN